MTSPKNRNKDSAQIWADIKSAFLFFNIFAKIFVYMHYEKKIFENGMKAIVIPMENTSAVTLLVLIGTGSRYESKNINGISHFLEHLFFKGTKSRPSPGEIASALDKIGAVYNAFTSKELTGFWVKSAYSDFDVSLDIVSDILLEPLFKEEEIERERGVILQEKNMREDMPPAKADEVLENVLYGDTPLGWDVIGTEESIKSIGRNQILDYLKNHYIGPNAVVIVAGNVDKNKTFSDLEKKFKRMPEGKAKDAEKEKDFQESPRIKLIDKKTDQMHFAMAVRAYDIFDERKYPLSLLATVMGGNMSSRLWMEIREKLGLAYYISSANEYYADAGYMAVKAGVPHEDLAVVLEKIADAFKGIRDKGVSEKELKDAKSFTRGRLALSLESSDEVAMFCGEQELLTKKILQPEEILEKIEKVSGNDILNIGRDILKPEKINLVAIGQHKDISAKTQLYNNLFAKL